MNNLNVHAKIQARREKVLDVYSFVVDILEISDAAIIQETLKIASIKQFAKGQLLYQQGEKLSQIMILADGITRGYYLDIKGKEITDCFAYISGDPVLPITDDNGIQQNNIEALTQVRVLSIPVDGFKLLLEKYPSLLRLAYEMSTKATQRHWDSKQARYLYTVKERYQWFLKEYPKIVDVISDKYIASFIGTTPETLSRVRRDMRKEQQ